MEKTDDEEMGTPPTDSLTAMLVAAWLRKRGNEGFLEEYGHTFLADEMLEAFEATPTASRSSNTGST